MNPNPEIREPEDSVQEVEVDASPSVDDFIKELEAKEKDLHITADYKIEISDNDLEMDLPDFVQQELASNPAPSSARSSQSGSGPGQKTRVYELEQEIEALKERIAVLKVERNDIQEKSDRRLKDFESYRYRMDRERRGAFINQIGNLALQMLPVLDNLDRAVTSSQDLSDEKRNEFRQFFDGIALVQQQINEVFSEMGVQPIATVGEEFDPNFHEAVAAEESQDLPPNTISAEMLRGYRIGNKVIRHSMVKVTTAGPSKKASSVKSSHKKPVLLDPDDNGVTDLPDDVTDDALDAE
jgi:molecular chaperone GrpE